MCWGSKVAAQRKKLVLLRLCSLFGFYAWILDNLCFFILAYIQLISFYLDATNTVVTVRPVKDYLLIKVHKSDKAGRGAQKGKWSQSSTNCLDGTPWFHQTPISIPRGILLSLNWYLTHEAERSWERRRKRSWQKTRPEFLQGFQVIPLII